MNAHTMFPTAAAKRYRILRRPPESIRPSTPRPVRRDCHGRLVAALAALVGEDGDVVAGDITAWASATFVGARHQIGIVMADGARARALAETLPEAEFSLPGHIVADLGIVALVEEAPDRHRLDLSVLTIEAW